jgi:hypothetical protein
MQRYILLIYDDETAQQQVSPDEQAVVMKAWGDYTAWLQEKGWYVAGDGLEMTSSATTVRERDGNVLTTDGPFSETKEQLGGYYVVRCDNLDEAIEAASKIPSDSRGSVEVRPIMEFPDEPEQS